MNTNKLNAHERQQLIDRLHAEKCSCVICNGEDVRIFRERGVKDLYRLLREEPEFLRGAFVADKVVGKAAAALMVLGGTGDVYVDVVSRPACDLFREYGLHVDYAQEVPHIINRTQTDWCPLEKRCASAATPEACLKEIEAFLEAMNK